MHDQTIDDASGVMERKPKGRRRTVAMLLAAAVAMVTFGVSSATTAGATSPPVNTNPNPYTVPGGCTVSTSGLVASAKLTWNKPIPSDFIAGYLITISPGAGDTSLSDTPPPFGVSGVDTLTAVVPNLIPGKHYNFVIQSVNLDSSVNSALAIPQCNNPAFPIVPNAAGVPGQAAAYVFGTNAASIKRHYEEFLQRDPNFSELSFWDRYYANSNALIGSCGTGGPGTNVPVQYALDPSATSLIGGFCPNSGPEFDLINFLYFGENNAGRQPFDTGGFYDNFNRKTYAGTAEPVTRLYLAYFGRIPDGGGYKYWYKKYQAGRSLDVISDFFAKSTEFKRQYGSLTDADFVTLVYINVLARNEDFGGQNFWRGQLESGISRGAVMAKFSESDEYNRISNFKVKAITLYEALVGSGLTGASASKKVPGAPTNAQVDTVVNLMNGAWDAYCFNSYNNEQQTVTLSTLVTQYTLTFNGQTTGNIAYNATAATVQTALEGLSNIAPGDVVVTGNAGGPYTVEFTGAYANTDVNALTATPNIGTITIATPTPGGQHGSTQYHYDSAILRSSGTTDLTGGHLVSTSTLACLQSGIAGSAVPVYFTDTTPPHAGLGFYTSPIVNLISTIRNSPAYGTAVGKPASLI